MFLSIRHVMFLFAMWLIQLSATNFVVILGNLNLPHVAWYLSDNPSYMVPITVSDKINVFIKMTIFDPSLLQYNHITSV